MLGLSAMYGLESKILRVFFFLVVIVFFYKVYWMVYSPAEGNFEVQL